MEVLETVDRERLAELHERDEFFWLDLTEPTAEDLKSVGEVLGLHPVALEDTIEFGQRPKLDQYGDHVLVVYYTARRAPESRETPVEPVEIHIYISGSFVVTVRRSTCTELDELHHELDTADPKAEHYIVYRIFDVLTDAFYPIIEVLEEHLDAIEAEVLLAKPRKEQLAEIYRLKQNVQELIAPRRAPARPLPRRHGDDPQPARPLARHARVPAGRRRPPGADRRRAASSAGGPPGPHRDVLQRQREPAQRVATRLTIGGTFFLAWTLVTGFFGQNFGWLVDNVDTRHDFLLYGVGALVVPTLIIGTVFWVKRKDWF